MNCDNLQAKIVTFGQAAIEVVKPFCGGFQQLVTDTWNKPLFDYKNLPADQVARVTHLGQESLKFLAKVLLIGSALYLASLSITFVKVIVIGGLVSSVLFTAAENEEFMRKMAVKGLQAWSEISGNKVAVAPELKPVNEVVVEEQVEEESQEEVVIEPKAAFVAPSQRSPVHFPHLA